MANTCKIKNSKKLNPNQIIDLVVSDVSKKYKLPITGEFHEEHQSFEFKIHGLSFLFFQEGNKLEFYDCPDTALSRHNLDHPYLEVAYKNCMYYAGVSSAFCFIYEYMKNFLASEFNSKIDSDGIGPYKAFENKDKFKSFNSWLDYCESKQSKGVMKLIKSLVIPTKKKILKTELEFFPELTIK